MSPKLFLGGSRKGNTWSIYVTDDNKSDKFEGYKLPESTLTQLVDAGVEVIVFIDPTRGRYVSDTDDWYEFGVWNDESGEVSLRQGWMDRA